VSPVRAFVVRPFGTKGGIDFERVHKELIDPVLTEAGIAGSTTEAIARAGNIRTDMFEELLLADVVIADISIHNANVYYELGIRHSLRPRTTILIRARKAEVPFDLKTDRYLEYQADDPGGSRAKLTEGIRQSLVSTNTDSPVFLLLPALEPTDVENFRPVPVGFTEAVISAQRSGDLPMLAVLADEAGDFDWGLAGLRPIARAQFGLRAWPDARATCEAIRARRPEDPEANLLLGTIYDRLGDPVASMTALDRVMKLGELARADEAEAFALKGRNIKNLWLADWQHVREGRQGAALRSAHLDGAREAYSEGFLVDQNHWYSGINALALLIVTISLAELQPDVWSERFETDDAAKAALAELGEERDELLAAVKRSLAAEAFRTRDGKYDVWADLTQADLRLLTSDRPPFVASGYKQAQARLAAEGTGVFPAESAAQQIRMYLELGLFAEKAHAALTALGVSEKARAPKPRARVIVFSGHRIDAPDRATPRFPADSVGRAELMIREAVEKEKELAGAGPIEGIAGGASGGDILFHEICMELGIPTTLMLAIPRDDYAAASVADAGPEWVERYRRLLERLEVKLLSQDVDLPDWLRQRQDYSIWQRNNRWTLHTALSRSDTDVSLIVLWDGKGGDGPGGTEDMVELAKSRGVRVVTLAAARLTEPGDGT
jgi:Tetratricopeptide Repeats-Sensor